MEYSKLNLFFFLVPCLILPSLVLGEPIVPCFFIFGDSILDNGNNIHRDTIAKVNYLPYGIDFPDGPTGRFTNGRNLADAIVELLGFEKYIPPFLNATEEELIGGVNYASGGSGILDKTGQREFGDIISMNEQLWYHKGVISRIAKLLGNKRRAKQHLSKCIYFVGMGSNDYLSTFFPDYYSKKSPYSPQQFASLLITRYSLHLRKVYYAGARKIAVYGVGKLGCVPRMVAIYGASNGSACVETSNDVVKIFREKLKLLVRELNYSFRDAKFVYTDDCANTYENFKEQSASCCSLSSEQQCLPGAAICSNRNEYIFWDDVHPTEASYVTTAKIAYNDMAPLFVKNNYMPNIMLPFGDSFI